MLTQRYRASGGNDAALQGQAVSLLETAATVWNTVVRTTQHLKPVPLFGMPGGEFSWEALVPMVERDATLAKIGAKCYTQLQGLCGAEKTLVKKGDRCGQCLVKKGKELSAAGCTNADTAVWCAGS